MAERESKSKAEVLRQLSVPDIDMLISRITKQNCHPETDTGAPVGREQIAPFKTPSP